MHPVRQLTQIPVEMQPRVATILRTLGVSYSEGKGFWERNAGQLHWIFTDAKKAYKKAVWNSHPDRGGSPEGIIALNNSWNHLKRRFKARLVRNI